MLFTGDHKYGFDTRPGFQRQYTSLVKNSSVYKVLDLQGELELKPVQTKYDFYCYLCIFTYKKNKTEKDC